MRTTKKAELKYLPEVLRRYNKSLKEIKAQKRRAKILPILRNYNTDYGICNAVINNKYLFEIDETAWLKKAINKSEIFGYIWTPAIRAVKNGYKREEIYECLQKRIDLLKSRIKYLKSLNL